VLFQYICPFELQKGAEARAVRRTARRTATLEGSPYSRSRTAVSQHRAFCDLTGAAFAAQYVLTLLYTGAECVNGRTSIERKATYARQTAAALLQRLPTNMCRIRRLPSEIGKKRWCAHFHSDNEREQNNSKSQLHYLGFVVINWCDGELLMVGPRLNEPL
jgi:hypothetical protein